MRNHAEIYATIRDWADNNHSNPVIGWEMFLTDNIVDNVSVDAGDVVEQVRDYLENYADQPEMYGASFPVYYTDTFDIYDKNGYDVDFELENFGGVAGIAEPDDSINTVIFKAVTYYVDSAARNEAMKLLEEIDALEEALEEEE